jgi:hypothetical protein
MHFAATPPVTMALETLAITLGIVAVYVSNRLRSKHTLSLPPGPKGLPILGNINDLPKPGILECHHWLKHRDLYGPISSVTVLGQTFVIINDPDIAMELLRDRASINSGRPKMVFSGDMIGWTNTLVMHQPDEEFKMHRRNIARVASSTLALPVFDLVQEEESAHFLMHVLETPEDLFSHIRKEAGAVILRITYGYTPEAHGRDPFIDSVGETLVQFADATSPGRYAVDVMPFCELQSGVTNIADSSKSTIPPGLVPRNTIQSYRTANGEAAKPNGRAAIRICQAADGREEAQDLVRLASYR